MAREERETYFRSQIKDDTLDFDLIELTCI